MTRSMRPSRILIRKCLRSPRQTAASVPKCDHHLLDPSDLFSLLSIATQLRRRLPCRTTQAKRTWSLTGRMLMTRRSHRKMNLHYTLITQLILRSVATSRQLDRSEQQRGRSNRPHLEVCQQVPWVQAHLGIQGTPVQRLEVAV